MAKTTMATTDTTRELTIAPEALAAIAKATIEAAQATTPRENQNPPPAWWNGFGLPDFPKLRHTKVYFCGAEQKPEKATKGEITLFNAITTPGDYGPDKTWPVKLKDGVLDIRIQGIHRREVRADLPRSLEDILRIIVEQQDAAKAA